MTDERRRRLEVRRGDGIEVESRWLIERVRTGDLALERLEWAAACGHAAAGLALGVEVPPIGDGDPPTWRPFAQRITGAGINAWMAVFIAIAEFARAKWSESRPEDVRLGRAVDVLVKWPETGRGLEFDDFAGAVEASIEAAAASPVEAWAASAIHGATCASGCNAGAALEGLIEVLAGAHRSGLDPRAILATVHASLLRRREGLT